MFQKKSTFLLNPYFIFLPFLLLFFFIVFRLHADAIEGEENRYYEFAQNLLNGFYSPPPPHINLWSGPGYSIFLIPFVGLKLPLITITLANAVLLYLAIIFLFKSLRKVVSFRHSLVFSCILGFYYNLYKELPYIITEIFTVFLLSLLIYCIACTFLDRSRKHLVATGFLLGWLALTKVIFGYVILIMLAGTLLLWLLHRQNKNFRMGFMVVLMALITNLPYLAYTHHLTGRFPYWANSGGMSLYWMSSPYEGEFGDWHDETLVDVNFAPYQDSAYAVDLIKKHHQQDYNEVYSYTGIEQDDAFKRIAIRNIKAHPAKYIQNIVSNAGRLVFNYPYAYRYETYHSLLRVVVNGILLTMILFFMIPTILNWRRLLYPIQFLMALVTFYMGATVLVSAYPRQYYVMLPIFLFWMAYMAQQSIKLNFNFSKSVPGDKSH